MTNDRLPVRKKILFVAILYVALLGCLEISARVVFYVKEGFNPYYLTLGLVPDREWHSYQGDGYTKYQPNTIRHQSMGRLGMIDIQINSDGFRSLTDFVKPKPEGVFRIVTLGSSSTFGYNNDDYHTYPYLLEKKLRASYSELEIQVFNLGIPHLRTQNIVALARHELRQLEPDVLTLYAGFNSAFLTADREEAGVLYRLKDWIYERSVGWRSIHGWIKVAYLQITKALQKDLVNLPNLSVPVEIGSERIEELRKASVRGYAHDLRELAALASEIGAELALITQNMNLYYLTEEMRDQWRRYDEELALVRERYEAKGKLPALQVVLLIHNDLMEELKAFAREQKLLLIDGRSVIDVDRSQLMSSFVHLTPVGNEALADAIFTRLIDAGWISAALTLSESATRTSAVAKHQPVEGIVGR